MHEKGLTDAIAMLGGTLVLLDDETINSQQATGLSAASRIGLSGVAEPCARAVSEHGEFLMEKRVFGRVTIAVAR
jgi:cobalt-precorrin 5A hydrolase